MTREIIVTITPSGDTKVETRGFSGSECLKATAELEALLGVTTHDTKTREFNQREQSTTNVVRNTR